jgi:hypothetical protein
MNGIIKFSKSDVIGWVSKVGVVITADMSAKDVIDKLWMLEDTHLITLYSNIAAKIGCGRVTKYFGVKQGNYTQYLLGKRPSRLLPDEQGYVYNRNRALIVTYLALDWLPRNVDCEKFCKEPLNFVSEAARMIAEQKRNKIVLELHSTRQMIWQYRSCIMSGIHTFVFMDIENCNCTNSLIKLKEELPGLAMICIAATAYRNGGYPVLNWLKYITPEKTMPDASDAMLYSEAVTLLHVAMETNAAINIILVSSDYGFSAMANALEIKNRDYGMNVKTLAIDGKRYSVGLTILSYLGLVDVTYPPVTDNDFERLLTSNHHMVRTEMEKRNPTVTYYRNTNIDPLQDNVAIKRDNHAKLHGGVYQVPRDVYDIIQKILDQMTESVVKLPIINMRLSSEERDMIREKYKCDICELLRDRCYSDEWSYMQDNRKNAYMVRMPKAE